MWGIYDKQTIDPSLKESNETEVDISSTTYRTPKPCCCSKLLFHNHPFSQGSDNPTFILSALAVFLASSENATFTLGMLSRRMHPCGFSGRNRIGSLGGRRSRGDGIVSDTLYLDTEHVSHPQNGAWPLGEIVASVRANGIGIGIGTETENVGWSESGAVRHQNYLSPPSKVR